LSTAPLQSRRRQRDPSPHPSEAPDAAEAENPAQAVDDADRAPDADQGAAAVRFCDAPAGHVPEASRADPQLAVLHHRNARNDPHHLISGPAAKERGMGLKATDRWAVPLSRGPHDKVQNIGSSNEVEWFRARGIADVAALATELWTATGCREAMERIVWKHRNGGTALG
jgi:hypothetical protein